MVKFLSNLVLALGLIISFGVFASLAKKLFWAFDLFTHFYLQYAVLLFVVLLFVLIVDKGKRKARALLILIPAFAIVLLNIAPFFIPQNNPALPTTTASPTLKAISLNLYLRNPNSQAIADYLKQEDADLILLTEATTEMTQALKAELGTRYPHMQDSSRRGAFGIVLFSKKPLDVAQTLNFRTEVSRRPGQSIYAVVEGVHIVGMHPLPPLNNYYSNSRNDELTGLKSFVENIVDNNPESPIILLGDFNASPWSWPLEDIIQDTSIKHGSLGQGLWPTWRIYGKGPIVFGAPIDHILVSENINTLSYTAEIVVGSDHSAVIAEVVLP